jgi:TPR repeat protein
MIRSSLLELLLEINNKKIEVTNNDMKNFTAIITKIRKKWVAKVPLTQPEAFLLGSAFFLGVGIVENTTHAQDLLMPLYLNSVYPLAVSLACMKNSKFKLQDTHSRLLMEAYQAGCAYAALQLAFTYTGKNNDLTTHYFTESIKLGCPPALSMFAGIHINGRYGFNKNTTLGLQYAKEAARLGNHPPGIVRDLVDLTDNVDYYRLAATAGNVGSFNTVLKMKSKYPTVVDPMLAKIGIAA